MNDLETRHYHLAWGMGAGRGTYIIIRVADGYTTLRNTGRDAIEDYKKLKRAYDISGSSFDAECSMFEYTVN